MVVTYLLTPELMEKLKRPFGLLIRGTFSENMSRLEEIMKKEKPTCAIAVGDRVSKNLHDHRIAVKLSITDNKSMRRRVKPVDLKPIKIVNVRNPKGTITDEAIKAIREAMRSKENTHILVEGEEDLLTLVAVADAPLNALVIYGQPHQGIVIVTVTAEKKAEAKNLLDIMTCSKS